MGRLTPEHLLDLFVRNALYSIKFPLPALSPYRVSFVAHLLDERGADLIRIKRINIKKV